MKDNSDKQILLKIGQVSNVDEKKVLEIGCGDGRISKLLVKKTDHLIGIDPDEEKIKQAQVTIPKGKFLIGSGENLDFSKEVFDLVIFTLSLHHQDCKKSLGEATRVLKKDGLILVIEPLLEGEIERVFAIVHNEDQAKIEAQHAIAESDLIVVQSSAFYAHWWFDNKEEVSEYIFNYYDMPFDTKLAQKIYGYLGAKAEKKQIELVDSMMIQALSKNIQSHLSSGR